MKIKSLLSARAEGMGIKRLRKALKRNSVAFFWWQNGNWKTKLFFWWWKRKYIKTIFVSFFFFPEPCMKHPVNTRNARVVEIFRYVKSIERNKINMKQKIIFRTRSSSNYRVCRKFNLLSFSCRFRFVWCFFHSSFCRKLSDGKSWALSVVGSNLTTLIYFW